MNRQIEHIMEYFYLPTRDQKKAFDREALEESKNHPLPRLDTEWGRFADLNLETEEEREALITDLLGQMSLSQKINQMSCDLLPNNAMQNPVRYNFIPYYAGEDPELDIPGIRFTDGPTGVVMGYSSTAFPVSMARAATFDRDLERRVGDAIGVESRSLGANLFAGVCINVVRSPLWGRAQESYGEDPYLLGEMGGALVEGVQHHVMACLKHFALNSIENSRFKVDVTLDERTLREVYLPHFKACIDRGAASVMSAYNRFRGEYCGHSRELLWDILKEDWGFDGFVMSDFIWGIRDGVAAANGGMDLEMNVTQYFGKRLEAAVHEGLVPEERIDESVRRLLRKKIQFSAVGTPERYGPQALACQAHRDLALEAAEKSVVLLKNDQQALPLDERTIRKVVVAGPLAGTPNIGDEKGSSAVFPPYVITPIEGLRERLGPDVELVYVNSRIPHEVQWKSQDADAVILVVGLNAYDEGEYVDFGNADCFGGDRHSLDLKPWEIDLIETVGESHPRTIVCLQGGSAIAVEGWDQSVAAILMQWYPGMEGGRALARILLGDVSPSGKLPVSFPADSQQMVYFRPDIEQIEYGFDHGYFHHDRQGHNLRYPFGHGLSYATFTYSNLVLEEGPWDAGSTYTLEVDVTNEGPMTADEVVQLYGGTRDSAVLRHPKDLRGFERVTLAPGETRTVRFAIDPQSMAYYDETTGSWIVEPLTYWFGVGPDSRKESLLRAEVEIRTGVVRQDRTTRQLRETPEVPVKTG